MAKSAKKPVSRQKKPENHLKETIKLFRLMANHLNQLNDALEEHRLKQTERHRELRALLETLQSKPAQEQPKYQTWWKGLRLPSWSNQRTT